MDHEVRELAGDQVQVAVLKKYFGDLLLNLFFPGQSPAPTAARSLQHVRPLSLVIYLAIF